MQTVFAHFFSMRTPHYLGAWNKLSETNLANSKNAYDMRNNQLIEVAIGNLFVFVVVDFTDLVSQ